MTDESRLGSLLDSLALGGEVNDAELVEGTRTWRSELLPEPQVPTTKSDDYAFGANSDYTYYVSTQLTIRGMPATLRIGFDERPTLEGITRTRAAVLAALGIYSVSVMAAAWFLSRYLARPLGELQTASRRVAMGELTQKLDTSSRIREFRALANDLESMRRELVGLNASLEEQILERAALESRIRQKQRLETVGTLAGGVAHELNNVLVPISLYSELALDSIGPEHAARDELVQLQAAVRRAGDIVSRVLVFSSRLEGQSRIPTDIAPAVEEGVRLFTALRPANIVIDADISGTTQKVLADHTLVVQVVMNLCTNAYHAMREDGGRLHVALRDFPDSGDGARPPVKHSHVRLTVEDSGHGMDAPTKERMFEPYFTTRPVGEGTGLGLSLVHGIVTEMGGSIAVESEPGKGTRVSILIPVFGSQPA
jgi:signal transduction histidine kinase